MVYYMGYVNLEVTQTMYEQNEVPMFRRILWIVLWFIVAVAVIWVLIWFIFFRDSSPKVVKKPSTATQKSQSTQKKPTKTGTTPAPSTSTDTGSIGTNQNNATTNPTGTTPSQLVNTGAGNIVVPFAVASVAGTTIYYVRLRRKLIS